MIGLLPISRQFDVLTGDLVYMGAASRPGRVLSVGAHGVEVGVDKQGSTVRYAFPRGSLLRTVDGWTIWG